MKQSVSLIFEVKPKQWGYRGDPYLWEDLKNTFISIPLPCSKERFLILFYKHFKQITNHDLGNEDSLFLDKYNKGGMSSGRICTRFWIETAIPMLVNQLDIVNKSCN